MRTKLALALLLASALPAMAAVPLPSSGNIAVITGRAHVEQRAQGTYIHVRGRDGGPSGYGFVSFGDEATFPGLNELNGRRVAIRGITVWDGRPLIILTDPNQLAVAG